VLTVLFLISAWLLFNGRVKQAHDTKTEPAYPDAVRYKKALIVISASVKRIGELGMG
jgi:hypothetical protein